MPQSAVLKQMAIGEILERYPQTRDVFQTFGLHNYAATETAKYENLEASALVHSVDLEMLVKALTKAIDG